MTIKEKLKKANKKTKTGIVTGALAMAAVLAPVKGQTAEAEPLTKDATTLVASQGATRQQMFETAVRANMPREEIAKYIDFPEFIPVDKNGQLDKKEVDKNLTYMLTNHFDALYRFYRNANAVTAPGFEEPLKFLEELSTFFAEVTGNTKNQPKFLRAITEATKQVTWEEYGTNVRKFRRFEKESFKWYHYIMLAFGSLAMSGTVMFLLMGGKERKAAVPAFLAGIALLYGVHNREIFKKGGRTDPAFMLNLMKAGAQRVYDTYVDNTIGFERDRQAEKSVKIFQQLKQKVETLDHVGNKDNQYIVLTPEEKKALQTLLQDKQTKR